MLDRPLRTAALQVAGTIAADLRQIFESPYADAHGPEAWALEGRSGAALFFAYYGTALGDEAALAFAARLLAQSSVAAAERAPMERLFGGFAGVAWTRAHLDGWVVQADEVDPNDAVDAALRDCVRTVTPWDGDYGLLGGLVGVGVYALERLPRAGALELVASVVDRLAELEHEQHWWTSAERLPSAVRCAYPNGAWNLGAAHGLPGLVAFLARARAAGVAAAGPLRHRAVAWLLMHRLPSDVMSALPAFAAPGAAQRSSPLAWCYGDAGAAGALSVAGEPAAAIAFAEQAARRTVSRSGIDNPYLCHGAAGLAHIFARLAHATDSDALRGAAERWLAEVFDRWPRDATGETGLLTGAAGVGLVLLAAATNLEPRWDRVLLLS
jgi:hypothetical protein